ncbi:MAG: sulfur oxidation c-type cytochrome SoxX [Burkholderiaceae bacterium]|nr:sulfur oxidation c-type cytochrome SoxX [Burkholderiaceae bacterium]
MRRMAAAVMAPVLIGTAAAAAAGDPARGEAIATSRSLGLCTLCHALPGQPPALQGNLGPPLAGIGARLDAQALRARLLTPERFNPDTLMPAYGRSEGLQRVAAAQRGRPLLTPAQIDDVVAYLAGLR